MSAEPFTLESINKDIRLVPGLEERYAARLPMTQLPDQYCVTRKNPKPAVVHFAIPTSSEILEQYTKNHLDELLDFVQSHPHIKSPIVEFWATDSLSEYIDYKLELGWPFQATKDCHMILILYNNYTMNGKQLVDEDEEDVIRLMQEELGLDESVRPKWYFDLQDPYEPDD